MGASGSMTHLTRRSFVGTAALLAAPALIRPAYAADTVKLGCLFSSSGTMANLEGRLNHVVRMAADEINGRGGVNGRQIEVVTSDPASDWPLYAQVGRQMLQQEKVAALFGCWTSVSRKSVLPVVEQNDGLLFYPLHFEGDENSKNVVYVNSPPASSVLPAVDYLMGPDGVGAKRFFMIGSDYVWPRTINKQLKGYWTGKGIPETAWREEYVPFGFSNFQTLVNQVRSFASQPGGQPIVVLTVVGSSIPDFLREFANQGISATDVPILGLDMVEADLEGLDTGKLVGHLNCWAYLQAAKGARNTTFLSDWASYVKAKNVPFSADTVIDPMVSAYDSVHLWALAAAKAGSFAVPEVRKAFAGLQLRRPVRLHADHDGGEQLRLPRGLHRLGQREARLRRALAIPRCPEAGPVQPLWLIGGGARAAPSWRSAASRSHVSRSPRRRRAARPGGLRGGPLRRRRRPGARRRGPRPGRRRAAGRRSRPRRAAPRRAGRAPPGLHGGGRGPARPPGRPRGPRRRHRRGPAGRGGARARPRPAPARRRSRPRAASSPC